ncbi:succinate dehydrogenase hydrophobic membrane anchor subunit [Phytoactinopolyspora halotolerans]|uniref:Succinate dehydrogenase hydrophobic membrane anchor subunit n=1 Tax=Phytoactinopolyspora halotolerans TaxID=1981512 RepID=A0A6L9S3M2_9ACTN|nr:succinate dehydrogenase hydrophobic membrane anchor subunit [Phytoactinopolyspora halotolerans]NED99636.1 succinate dehydrogenase hydrophobic membrane anchor subunit [Phytoactinopolyspora halotolerans]
MAATTIAAPRSPRSPRSPRRMRGRTNTELYAWLFMRVSGVLLMVLVFGHLFVNLMVGEGINALDFAFVAGKWADPFWQVWDLLMLWLAMIHGSNGLRTIINDYAERDQLRMWLKVGLYTAAAITIVLGTLVIFTFDPCPADAAAELLPSFCPAP